MPNSKRQAGTKVPQRVLDELRAYSSHDAKPDVMRSLPPSEDKIKEALLLGYVVGRCSTADIDENVLWDNYKKHILKLNSDTQNEAAMPT